jgi:hypothetical protein
MAWVQWLGFIVSPQGRLGTGKGCAAENNILGGIFTRTMRFRYRSIGKRTLEAAHK